MDPEQATHREVAEELRARIRTGALRPGQRMPTDVSKGSPARVAPAPVLAQSGPGAPPLPTTVALGPRIVSAFAAPHVEIDALCLTSISLNLAIGEPVREIYAGRLKPDRVDMRVLLPSRNIHLAFPVPVERHGDDELVHERWVAQRNAQGQVLQHHLHALRTLHGIDARISFRALPFTPPVKLYLLNGAEALFAYYTLRRREEEIDHEPLEMYDTEGTRSMLFAFEQGAGARDTTFVEQSHLWFNALWETISSELVLTA